ncbi:hypothetical protein SeMB42_g03688 [Synchytrium endobioticum]|uniref:GPI mannosyltransferase 1 n=1 Tax=Synchytrium endobioticum TaxID=286115 RepID=A0A507D4Q8_9FUNG|nr:hypothetical protein SeLEV6574_g03997 [Synchytrium endobioticum]TPX46453.1 hypothetical protein SeMB42_g03688 [Synchytrium endobioticum]
MLVPLDTVADDLLVIRGTFAIQLGQCLCHVLLVLDRTASTAASRKVLNQKGLQSDVRGRLRGRVHLIASKHIPRAMFLKPPYMSLLVTPLALRLALLLYGLYQDSLPMPIKYTDIDYLVFTDAANHTYHNESPYARSTYRYTPLLSYLLVPGIHLGWEKWWGKLVFVACDILNGCLLYRIGRMQNVDVLIWIVVLWNLNPFVATISTRGSSESVVIVLVLGAIYLMMSGKWRLASVVLGIAIHFKIYPIIYGISFLMHCKEPDSDSGERPASFDTLKQITFFFICGTTFCILSSAMYILYGSAFLQESYLYHLSRQDHRHNFSIYFYYLYLTSSSTTPSVFARLVSFTPQLGLVVLLGMLHGRYDLPFACFSQTFAFVMLNKVVTSQYFMWYLCFLPVILPSSNLNGRKGVVLLVGWTLGQAVWLSYAYQLEHLGRNTFRSLCMAGCLFFIINCVILVELIRAHSLASLTSRLKAQSEKQEKIQ